MEMPFELITIIAVPRFFSLESYKLRITNRIFRSEFKQLAELFICAIKFERLRN